MKHAKHSKRPVSKKGHKKAHKAFTAICTNPDRMVLKLPKKSHVVFPRSMVTVSDLSWSGFCVAANINYPAINFAVYLNKFTAPFNTGIAITSLGFTSTTDASIGQQYAGYTILNSIYTEYRIHKARLTIDFDCNGSDLIGCVIAPTFTLTGGATTYTAMTALPYAKSKIFASTETATSRRISSGWVSAHKLAGLTKQQYNDLPMTTIGNTPASNVLSYFDCMLSMRNSNGTNASTQGLTMKLEAEIEFGGQVEIFN